MLARNRKPEILTEPEEQHLLQTRDRLRQLNRAALSKLRSMLSITPTKREIKETAEVITAIATQITLTLDQRAQIISTARENRFDLISVEIGVICNRCPCPIPAHKTENAKDADEALKEDPTHRPEIQRVLEMAHSACKRLSQPNMPSGACRKRGIVAVKMLIRALLRQGRHLQEIAPSPPAPRIEVVTQKRKTCSVCDVPLTREDPSEKQLLEELGLSPETDSQLTGGELNE